MCFRLARFQGPSAVACASAACLYGQVVFHCLTNHIWLSSQPVRDMRAVVHVLASFWLLLIVLLWLVVQSVYLNIFFQFFCIDAHEWDCWGTLGHMLSFLMNLSTVFQSCCTILCSHQQCTRVPTSPCVHQYLFPFLKNKIKFILGSGKWSLTVVLSYMFLVTNDVKHPFLCLLI